MTTTSASAARSQDAWKVISKQLSVPDLATMAQTSHALRDICDNETTWRDKYCERFGTPDRAPSSWKHAYFVAEKDAVKHPHSLAARQERDGNCAARKNPLWPALSPVASCLGVGLAAPFCGPFMGAAELNWAFGFPIGLVLGSLVGAGALGLAVPATAIAAPFILGHGIFKNLAGRKQAKEARAKLPDLELQLKVRFKDGPPEVSRLEPAPLPPGAH